MVSRLDVSINYIIYNLLILFLCILLTYLPILSYYDIPVTEIRKLINAIDNGQTVFNYYPPIISEKLRKLVVLTNDNKEQTKEEPIQELKQEMKKQIEQTETLTKQNVELKQQMERIIKYIGVEQDNKEEKDNEKVQDSEKIQDNKEEQDNKLEMQIEQTKEELPKQSVGLKQQMDKLEQQMDNIMKYNKEEQII
jgi:hypothetical protein